MLSDMKMASITMEKPLLSNGPKMTMVLAINEELVDWKDPQTPVGRVVGLVTMPGNVGWAVEATDVQDLPVVTVAEDRDLENTIEDEERLKQEAHIVVEEADQTDVSNALDLCNPQSTKEDKNPLTKRGTVQDLQVAKTQTAEVEMLLSKMVAATMTTDPRQDQATHPIAVIQYLIMDEGEVWMVLLDEEADLDPVKELEHLQYKHCVKRVSSIKRCRLVHRST